MHTSTEADQDSLAVTPAYSRSAHDLDNHVIEFPNCTHDRREIDALMLHLERAAVFDAGCDSDTGNMGRALKGALVAASVCRTEAGQAALRHIKCAVAAYLQTDHAVLRSPVCSRGGLAPWQVSLAKRMLLEQMETNVSINLLARACKLSRGHFTRSFKQTVGVPPHRWLQERRIAKAKELLASDSYVLAEVAMKCGFTDQAHFSRVFKVMTHCTPFSWRRQTRVIPDFAAGNGVAG